MIGKKAAARIYLNWWRLHLRRVWRRRLNRLLMKNSKDILHVRIDSPVGLFAHLSWCLEVAAFSEKQNLLPFINCTSRQYGDGRGDWFNIFFHQPHISAKYRHAPPDAPVLRIREFEEMPFFMDFNPNFTIEEISRLQRTYFPVSENIIRKVDTYVENHFRNQHQDRRIVGCHYRGTDKGVEAARIAYAEMTVALQNALGQFPKDTALFIATDEAAFLAHIRAALPHTPLLSADHKRSTDGRALHFTRESHGLANGEQALIDCLLLSRCDLLVKSPSALSAWAKIFNPQIPVTLVGRPYPHAMFCPESIIVRQHDELLRAQEKAAQANAAAIMLPEPR